MFHKVVIANRGAVAARLVRALRELGVRTVAVYSEADAGAPYLHEADEAFPIGAAAPQHSYLNKDALIDVIRSTRADGLHPGYGFLSENASFAEQVEAAGCTFIGPHARWIRAMGEKTGARRLMSSKGLPVASGSAILTDDPVQLHKAAHDIGYPVLIKPAAGGGGIGMIVARNPEELEAAIARARSMAQRSFASADIYLERLLLKPRHIEIQILADRHGNARHLFERDCSIQRRHQKLIEECPAPGLERSLIASYADKTVDIIQTLGYDNIGTVENLLDQSEDFHFLEMNTRLQVEHAVTEEVTGVDLVKAQIQSAAGQQLGSILPPRIRIEGHAIEARVYAEDPKTFYPSPGHLKLFRPPSAEGIRIETGYAEGRDVTPYYDPMIAKVVAKDTHRPGAILRLMAALENFAIEGVKTNIPFLLKVLGSEAFKAGEIHTQIAAEIL